ncbi:tumor necrosis factor receptor superfamily member 14 isoform X3 [Dasypus novemcinctus]|uniref:tumor necrosis factor receptor superfamily member 14 isoform X3 n=1 Tax=Dasypus novemcinctus TaxID=9361 RepID=UPI00265FCDE2|nr:tumor necrosis factor receptor superfamily member 14 isoform X3 [Dasypus novemcinctus]
MWPSPRGPGTRGRRPEAAPALPRPARPCVSTSVSLSFLALGVVLLASAHPSLTQALCKDEEYPVGSACCPKCDPGFRVKEAHGALTCSVCVPCLAGTYTAHLNGLSECLQCRVCDPGTEWQDTLCEDCPAGTFTPHGALRECQPWTQCRGLLEWEAAPGTSSSDATCASSRNYLWALLLVLVSAAPGIIWLYLKKRRAPGHLHKVILSRCCWLAHCLGRNDTNP